MSTPEAYEATMKKRGLIPEQVSLPHDTEGYWIGNKTAKNVLVYYHGKPSAQSHPIHYFPHRVKDQTNPQSKLAYMNSNIRRRLLHGRPPLSLRILDRSPQYPKR